MLSISFTVQRLIGSGIDIRGEQDVFIKRNAALEPTQGPLVSGFDGASNRVDEAIAALNRLAGLGGGGI